MMRINDWRLPSFAIMLCLFLSLLFVPQADGQIQQERIRFFQNRRGVNLLLLSTREIRRELDVSREQRRMVEALADDVRAQRGRRDRVSERLIRVVLDERQAKRLVQLRLQFEGGYAMDDEDFSKELALTDKQQDAVRTVRKEKVVLKIDDLKEAIGEEPFAKWRKGLGETYEFSGELALLRDAYLKQRQFFELNAGR